MNFSRSRAPEFAKLQFTPPNDSYVNAGQYAPFAGVYGAYQKAMPRFADLAATSVATRSAERAAITQAEGNVMSMGLSAIGTVEAAKAQAEGLKSAAQSKANGQMVGSALQAVGSIGGALLLSDATTKENVAAIDDGLSVIKKLQPKTYNYKPEWQGYSNRKHSGFIAQEYQKVIPEGTYNDEESGKLCVDLAEVIAPLVSAVQQLEARISELENNGSK